jgi:PIN domain nuclease of toxin-antitoxin system
MSLLVDTNIVINAHHRAHLLSAEVTKLLQGRSQVRFSAAVPWEIAVKAKLGKFPYPMEPLLATLREEHFHELPITAAHGIEAGMLPLHHRDPFDRIMIAQARMERLTLVTADRLFAAYEVDLLLT